MFDPADLRRAAVLLDGFVGGLDVEATSVPDAKALVATLAAMGRQVDAAVALLGARVADAAASERDAARWLAGQTRSSEGEARDTVRNGRSARKSPGTRAAFQRGDLSARTAGAIGDAAEASPGSEQRLLDLAAQGSAEATRREAHRTRQRASRETDTERERRRHARRTFSSWEDDDGGIAGRFATTTRQWAPVGATLDVFRQAAFARARRTGQRADTGSAYTMDGLELMAHIAAGGDPVDLGYTDTDLPAALRHRLTNSPTDQQPTTTATTGEPAAQDPATGTTTGEPADHDPVTGAASDRPADHAPATGTPDPPTADPPSRGGGDPPTGDPPDPPSRTPRSSTPGFYKLIVRVDATALQRGHAEPGETCDIAGVGPVSVTAVRDLLPDAFVAVVITKGHDVATVAHLGRRPNAYQQTALEWRNDRCCTRGCQHRARLQADHDDPWADTHHTWLPDLNRTCDQCHARKTHQNWAWIGDLDAHGTREQVPPHDPRHPTNAPTTTPRPRPPEIHPKDQRTRTPTTHQPTLVDT